jgi:hypothetical protein
MATATATAGSGSEAQQPVQSCEQPKSSILAEVLSQREGSTSTSPVSGAKVQITNGPTSAAPATTGSNGRAEFKNLDPGSYTLEVSIEGDAAKKYDMSPAPAPQTWAVLGAGPEAFVWVLRVVWIEARVQYADGTAVAGIPYILRVKKLTGNTLATTWETHKDQTSTSDTYSEEGVPKGRYELVAKIVTEPAWSTRDDLAIGTAVTLTANAPWAADGASGKFELYDVLNTGTVLHTLTPTVASGRIESAWTPAKDQLTNLKSGLLVFKATVDGVSAFSPVAKINAKEKIELVDAAGTKLTKRVTLRMSGGSDVVADVDNGEVEVVLPWGQTIARVAPASLPWGRLKIEDGTTTKYALNPA